ncbi:hypothetical protein KMW28_16640 [Flammeovirga yaeyamensis]|uniref:Uncharacterized protein n=1 Tax=Flammeovirga yaeyamensis TaxID=367791 RepID=A0AAX1N1E5_9BACT|nr:MULTISPECIES: hypothetical protein [Flammeovirga]ANQ51304.1 hypothetical protein MY04_3960 [Flammeovirga sp. MY04]MBB3698359.1 hypothetical protein [Flammeovirga yaeyamensis]NMF34289.1 hypothetical protein [Flammeovirga yaeyamensis]QWG01272.1 hypothetical protein KMW28_16640 [Flammeovirga yaeyamensis]
MAIISKKKVPYPVTEPLEYFLDQYDRLSPISIDYNDLLRFNTAVPLYDSQGEDTLWVTVYYPQDDMEHIYSTLKELYASLRADGNLTVMEHLFVERVDMCTYGNTKPFRIRIVNRVNDNFDYFYIKVADASRIYGLELEDILSPNKVSYLVTEQTLIEEHIPGIPGDMFINNYLEDGHQNKTRLAKEFIKFNERCFVQLLGDMHSSNWVVLMVPDFDEINYRIRPIDFDQQSYEGRRNIYMPQFYRQNNPVIQLGMGKISWESVRQYQAEERFMIATRVMGFRHRAKDILKTMRKDIIAPHKNVETLRDELTLHYKNNRFSKCENMGEIVTESIEHVLKQQEKYKDMFNFESPY